MISLSCDGNERRSYRRRAYYRLRNLRTQFNFCLGLTCKRTKNYERFKRTNEDDGFKTKEERIFITGGILEIYQHQKYKNIPNAIDPANRTFRNYLKPFEYCLPLLKSDELKKTRHSSQRNQTV